MNNKSAGAGALQGYKLVYIYHKLNVILFRVQLNGP